MVKWHGDEAGARVAMSAVAAAEGGAQSVGLACSLADIEARCTGALARAVAAAGGLEAGAKAAHSSHRGAWEGALDAAVDVLE